MSATGMKENRVRSGREPTNQWILSSRENWRFECSELWPATRRPAHNRLFSFLVRLLSLYFFFLFSSRNNEPEVSGQEKETYVLRSRKLPIFLLQPKVVPPGKSDPQASAR